MIVRLALALSLMSPPDHWFGSDKLKHFFLAVFTQSVTYSALQAAHVRHEPARTTALAVTAAVSVAKELHDLRTTGRFSVRDLMWDAAGAGTGALLLEHAARRPDTDRANRTTQPSSLLSPFAPAPILPRVAPSASAPVR